MSRVERVVGEHQLFSQGLQELQNWVSESKQVLKTCRCPTSDKSVLITRMGQLEVHCRLLYTFYSFIDVAKSTEHPSEDLALVN